MVQTSERPAETQITPERSFGRSFFSNSRAYYLDFSDLMTADHCMVFQVSTQLEPLAWDGPDEQLYKRLDEHVVKRIEELAIPQTSTETLLFEKVDDQQYRWQLHFARSTGRTVVEISSRYPDEAQGYYAQYSQSGSLEFVDDLDLEGIESAWSYISSSLSHHSVRQNHEKLRNHRDKLEEQLAAFVVTNEIPVVSRADQVSHAAKIVRRYWDADEAVEMVIFMSKLPRATKSKKNNHFGSKKKELTFESHLTKLQENIKKSGLPAFQLDKCPEFSVTGINSPEHRPYYWQGSLLSAVEMVRLKRSDPN